MEELLLNLGEVLDTLPDWIYSLTSGLASGDIEAPEVMMEDESFSYGTIVIIFRNYLRDLSMIMF